jgi:hypothetical protein
VAQRARADQGSRPNICATARPVEARLILEAAIDNNHAIPRETLQKLTSVGIGSITRVPDESDDGVAFLPQGIHEEATEAPGCTDQQYALRHI